MARRKSWDELSENYKKRLLAKGIGPEQHAQGASLFAARGKKSAQHEQELSRRNRAINRWVADFSKLYGRDPSDVREALEDLSKSELWSAIQLQQKMQHLYNEGRIDQARALWLTRDTSLPDWMFYYHGYFS